MNNNNNSSNNNMEEFDELSSRSLGRTGYTTGTTTAATSAASTHTTIDVIEQVADVADISLGSDPGNPQDDYTDHDETEGDHEEEDDDDDADEGEGDHLQRPLLVSGSMDATPRVNNMSVRSASVPHKGNLFRSRKTQETRPRRKRRQPSSTTATAGISAKDEGKPEAIGGSDQSSLPIRSHLLRRMLCTMRSTIHCMNVLAKVVLWGTIVALTCAVFWYSYEFYNYGTEPHMIAWFSAGAFVLLGFPIAMWGIVSHLANFNQPQVQQYIVRILWMVPIYSIESWLAMRFHKQAIYIETLRDFYESYVLYSFLQFLIEVLGGEETLVLMLKDKSPTRGHHMWGLQWCMKPWLMGQPVRKTVYEEEDENTMQQQQPDGVAPGLSNPSTILNPTVAAPIGDTMVERRNSPKRIRAVKRIKWTSPFFVHCKFGVLQYVLFKFLCAIAVLLMEWQGWYKEGEFKWGSGYLYICILTNISQCWALYCLIFFYYATHTELSPIRPVGKFLSVKAVVFFTWWQSVMISILYQMDMIPGYAVVSTEPEAEGSPEWTPEDVAKGIQDYLICMEMFLAAVVHTFVFPHSEYSPQAVEARTRALHQMPMKWNKKRIGRNQHLHWKDDASKNSAGPITEMVSLDSGSMQYPSHKGEAWEHLASGGLSEGAKQPSGADLAGSWDEEEGGTDRDRSLSPVQDDEESEDAQSIDEDESQTVPSKRPGFVGALLASTIPRDLGASTVGMFSGDYVVEKKTLLQTALVSDQYELFSRTPRRKDPSI